MTQEWFCKRCLSPVESAEDMGDFVAGKCRCDSSPSPWIPVPHQPTHQCTVCTALWRKHDDGTWSLCSPACGQCCDNVPMGEQIAQLETVPSTVVPPHEARGAFIQDIISRKIASARSDHVRLPILTADHVLEVLIEHHRMKCAEEGVAEC